MKGFIIYSTYDTIENQTIIKLFGRLENGKSFVTINKINPYFYIRKKDLKKLPPNPKPEKIEETKLKNFNGEEVSKIYFKTKSDLSDSQKVLHNESEIYEADLRPHYRFIIDKNILGSIEIDG